MATLTVKTLDEAGFEPLSDETTSAASGGDEYVNDERTFLYVDNTGTANPDVTLAQQAGGSITVNGGGTVSVSDLKLTVNAGNQALIAAPKKIYNDGSGKVQVTYSDNTGMNVAAFKMADALK